MPSITASVKFQESLLPELELEWLCGTNRQLHRLNKDQTLKFEVPESDEISTECHLSTVLPLGYSATYSVNGQTPALADGSGCHFEALSGRQTNRCDIMVNVDPVPLIVYLKWIGGSGLESDVQVFLECESGDYSGTRFVNEGYPNGWQIGQVPPEGILCNVIEAERETYRPDIIDCQGLWLRPGRGEECTLVNTKIVKRIEMLNRYGAVVMGILVLLIGLYAVRRLV